jgi:hypothetical protein
MYSKHPSLFKDPPQGRFVLDRLFLTIDTPPPPPLSLDFMAAHLRSSTLQSLSKLEMTIFPYQDVRKGDCKVKGYENTIK